MRVRSFDLAFEPFEEIRGVDLAPVHRWTAQEWEHVYSFVFQDRCRIGLQGTPSGRPA